MKRTLLAQRELIVFDPWDALNIPDRTPEKLITFRKTSARSLSIDIYGIIGISDLTGHRTIEDLEVWCGDGDITNGLTEAHIQELIDSVLEDYP